MRQLVSSLRLAPAAAAAAGLAAGDDDMDEDQQQQQQQLEQLVPDDTLNPSIQRFFWFMGQRALDPLYQVNLGEGVSPQVLFV